MTPSEQPPEETFCLTCGPGTVLERHGGAELHCLRCGIPQPVPDFPLFVVTGASGAGKTTITAPLRQKLPGCDVFDTDIILQVAALGWDTWRNTWLRLAHAIALNGRVTVLCGSLLPSQLESLPARKLVGPIRFCTLDCPDTVLAGRLRRRPSWRGTSTQDAIAPAPAVRRLAAGAHPALLRHQPAHPRRDSRAHRHLDKPKHGRCRRGAADG